MTDHDSKRQSATTPSTIMIPPLYDCHHLEPSHTLISSAGPPPTRAACQVALPGPVTSCSFRAGIKLCSACPLRRECVREVNLTHSTVFLSSTITCSASSKRSPSSRTPQTRRFWKLRRHTASRSALLCNHPAAILARTLRLQTVQPPFVPTSTLQQAGSRQIGALQHVDNGTARSVFLNRQNTPYLFP